MPERFRRSSFSLCEIFLFQFNHSFQTRKKGARCLASREVVMYSPRGDPVSGDKSSVSILFFSRGEKELVELMELVVLVVMATLERPKNMGTG